MSVSLDRKLYGLEPGERETMESRQYNRCAICQREPRTRRLSVDHCHLCAKYDRRGSVRGLLCHRCNRHLFGDDIGLLLDAYLYFLRHVCSPKPAKRSRPAASPDTPAQEKTINGRRAGIRRVSRQ